MSAVSLREWADRFTNELAMVVGALIETAAFAIPDSDRPGSGWTVTLAASHGAEGTLAVHFDRVGAEAFCKRIMGLDIDAPEPAVIDTLKEVCAQAAGSLVQKSPLQGTTLNVEDVSKADQPAAGAVFVSVAAEGVEPLLLGVSGGLGLVSAAAPPAAPSNDQPRDPKLDVILDIDLPLMIRFGRTEMPLRALTALGPGSVIDLGRSPDDPVEVLVSNQVVARGEVVIVAGNYGVRITDVISTSARARSMEVEGK
jgi:flagellar motor switch protein FliN/FliY